MVAEYAAKAPATIQLLREPHSAPRIAPLDAPSDSDAWVVADVRLPVRSAVARPASPSTQGVKTLQQSSRGAPLLFVRRSVFYHRHS